MKKPDWSWLETLIVFKELIKVYPHGSHGKWASKTGQPVKQLSQQLKSLGLFSLNRIEGSSEPEKFRNANGVSLKVQNILSADPRRAEYGITTDQVKPDSKGKALWEEYYANSLNLEGLDLAIDSERNSEDVMKVFFDFVTKFRGKSIKHYADIADNIKPKNKSGHKIFLEIAFAQYLKDVGREDLGDYPLKAISVKPNGQLSSGGAIQFHETKKDASPHFSKEDWEEDSQLEWKQSRMYKVLENARLKPPLICVFAVPENATGCLDWRIQRGCVLKVSANEMIEGMLMRTRTEFKEKTTREARLPGNYLQWRNRDKSGERLTLAWTKKAYTDIAKSFEDFSFVESKEGKAESLLEASKIDLDFDDDMGNCDHLSDSSKAYLQSIKKRNKKVVKELKKLYKKCQITGEYWLKANGEPYLEAHHVIPLAEDGADKAANLIVISAEIHRKLHYAKVEGLDLKNIKNNKLSFTISGKEHTILWDESHASLIEKH